VDLTVVIPAKNEAKYINICLESLELAIQEWGGNAEIILVDNGSTDATKQIAEKKGCKIFEQPDGAISKVRNIGAQNAYGNILAFLDADCLVAPEWISFCLQNLSDERIAAVGTRAVPDFNTATWVEKAWYKLVTGAKRPNFVEWLGTSNLFIKKDVFYDIGGFDEKLETGEDINLCHRIRRTYRIYLEKRINTIHLRESKTLIELFRREYWRGKSSLKTFKESNFSKKELPSVAAPAVNLLSVFLFFMFFAIKSKLAIICGTTILILPLLFMMKKQVKTELSIAIIECYIVAFVYIFARSCALGAETLNLLKGDQL